MASGCTVKGSFSHHHSVTWHATSSVNNAEAGECRACRKCTAIVASGVQTHNDTRQRLARAGWRDGGMFKGGQCAFRPSHATGGDGCSSQRELQGEFHAKIIQNHNESVTQHASILLCDNLVTGSHQQPYILPPLNSTLPSAATLVGLCIERLDHRPYT